MLITSNIQKIGNSLFIRVPFRDAKGLLLEDGEDVVIAITKLKDKATVHCPYCNTTFNDIKSDVYDCPGCDESIYPIVGEKDNYIYHCENCGEGINEDNVEIITEDNNKVFVCEGCKDEYRKAFKRVNQSIQVKGGSI